MLNFVYWIHDNTCSSINDGYVGVSKNPFDRFKAHLGTNRVPSNSSLKVIFAGSRVDCFTEERRLRPGPGIGWNSAIGGSQGFKDGFVHSSITKAKLKNAWTEERKLVAKIWKTEQNKLLKGQKRPKQSASISGKLNPMYGKTHTHEAKEKIRKANLLKVGPPSNFQDLYCIYCHQRSSFSRLIKYHNRCKPKEIK